MNEEKEQEILDLVTHIASSVNRYDIEVNTMEDALQIANKLKNSSEYDLFRGQSGLWPLISSFNRLDEKEQVKLQEKIGILRYWANENLDIQDEDTITAIAQHYRVPTNFVDFSTKPEVAAFFASCISEKNLEPNEYSCIICINSDEITEIIEILKQDTFKDKPYPEVISIDIDNLWHLEAQKGKFLYLPYIGFELGHLPFKRIIFKRSENNISKFDKSEYIPNRQSDLEEKFYGYIQMAKLLESAELFKDLSYQVTGAPPIQFETSSYNKEFCIEERLMAFQWDEKDISQWSHLKVEKYNDLYTQQTILIKIFDLNIEEQIYSQILNEIQKNDNIRNLLVNWEIDTIENQSLTLFNKYANKIWDGMRKLPYTNEDIASVMSRLNRYLKLLHKINNSTQPLFPDDIAEILGQNIEIERKDSKRLFDTDIVEIIEDYIEVEVHNKTSNFNKAFVSRKLLKDAMRDDLDKIILFKLKDTQNIDQVIHHIKQANLLYKFKELKSLFVESIILTQLFSYDENFVIFSPLELKWIT